MEGNRKTVGIPEPPRPALAYSSSCCSLWGTRKGSVLGSVMSFQLHVWVSVVTVCSKCRRLYSRCCRSCNPCEDRLSAFHQLTGLGWQANGWESGSVEQQGAWGLRPEGLIKIVSCRCCLSAYQTRSVRSELGLRVLTEEKVMTQSLFY